ncbi:helix-turn-helix domain-containing protein [Patescibacteria group bacterium]|nr:MAG: helix-turn-helix domain-containing protein [Patescibacteria group bacterium]
MTSRKAKPLGEILRQARTDKGLSLAEVEQATRIRGKYLTALEQGDYQTLPHLAYTKGFIQSYAELLEIDSQPLVERYQEELGQHQPQLGHPMGSISLGSTISPRKITLAVITLVVLMVVGYFFWQFSALTAPPKLQLSSPVKDEVLYGSLLTVKGQVDGGANVFINDTPILSDAQGNFESPIALQEGVNVIRVTAKNQLGKTSTITRNILARVPAADASTNLPAGTFDGVAVSIKIKDATTSVTVRSDGKQVFQGTMLPGTVQNFRATNKIIVSTSNAGATQLSVSNTLSAAVNLGAIGQLGQSRNNLEFARDTEFR